MRRKEANCVKTLIGWLLAVLLLVPAAQAQTSSSDSSAATSSTSASLFGTCPVPDASDTKKAEQYSLYYENYKNDDFKAAMPYLRWILKCDPAFAGTGRKDTRNLRRAVKAYEGLAKQAQSTDRKQAYLDSALTVIDRAVPIMQKVGVKADPFTWTFRRGYFIQTHGDQLPDVQGEAAAAYRKAYKLSPKRLIKKDTTYYLDAILRGYSEQDSTQALFDFIRKLEQRFSGNKAIMGLIDQYVKSVSPDQRMAYYERRLEQKPDDPELIQTLFEMYKERDMRDKMYELGSRLRDMEPSPATNRTLAQMYLEDGEYQQALDLYTELMEMEGVEPTKQDYYNMGLAHQNLMQLASARNYYRQALELDAGYGQAYAAIGDVYAVAVDNCSGGSLERADRAVYWLATDYYQKAKSATSSLSSRMNQKISTYRQSYPSQDSMFFENWEAGQSYTIDYGCYSWIGETTTVKQAS